MHGVKRAHARDLHRDVELPADAPDALSQPIAHRLRRCKDLGRQLFHRGHPSGHGDGVSRKRPGLRDAGTLCRVEQLHDVSSPTKSTHRQATADDLSHCSEVRQDAVALLSATKGNSQADDLIEDQHDAKLAGHLPQHRQVVNGCGNHARRAKHRLHDYRR